MPGVHVESINTNVWLKQSHFKIKKKNPSNASYTAESYRIQPVSFVIKGKNMRKKNRITAKTMDNTHSS
jgi:hypothetical protein